MERTYIRYEIEKRKWSSNAIVGIYLHTTETGEVKEKSQYILTCGLPKSVGDKYVNKIIAELSKPIVKFPGSTAKLQKYQVFNTQ